MSLRTACTLLQRYPMSHRARAGQARALFILLGLPLVLGLAASAQTEADPAPAPPWLDYWSESRLLVGVPGASASLAAGWFNPAAWPMRGTGGLYFAWDEPVAKAAGAPGAALRAEHSWLGAVSTRNLAFGARRYGYELPGGDERGWTEYTLGLGGGEHGYAWGVAYAWSRADEALQARDARLTLGAIHRWRPFSLGLATHWNLDRDQGLVQADIGVRPFGPRLTFFADATFDEDLRFDDMLTRRWRTGYGVTAHVLRGLSLSARGYNTGEVSVSVGLGLLPGGRIGGQVHYDSNREHAASSYRIETQSPLPDLGLFRERGAYPELHLRGPLVYRTYRWFDDRRTLLATLRRIDRYATDPGVDGVVLNLSGMQIGAEQLYELRAQLAGLRARGKKVVVYCDRAGMSGYYLASVADQIWMDPIGTLELSGVAIGRSYYRRALEKLGVGVDEWRYYTYKSAFESFSRTSLSAADREQFAPLLDATYETIAAGVTAARGLSKADWDAIIDEQAVLTAEEAQAVGLIDSLGTFRDALDAARRAARRSSSDPAVASVAELFGGQGWERIAWGDRDRIALLYAIGVCDMDEGIRARTLAKQLRAAADDAAVKAIVLRADSPGGDGLASDYVAREMKRAAQKKPVLVSQGHVAGSGGYWISMHADTILAAPYTLTGSIGVIGGWFWDDGLGEKLGIDYDGLQRGVHADLGRGMSVPLIGLSLPERPLTTAEQERIRALFAYGYDYFTEQVAEGRGMTVEDVDGVGQGRVWSGRDGQRIGLIDELGGLWDALVLAKGAAGIPPEREVVLTEGPSLGAFRLPSLGPSLFRAFGLAPQKGRQEEAAVLGGPAWWREWVAAHGITEQERLYLERMMRSPGEPLYLMEPLELRLDGAAQ